VLEWNIYSGPPETLVLLPAFPFSSEMWSPLIAELRDDFTLLVADYPGFGASQAPMPTGWTFGMVSDEIKRKLITLKKERVALCGISMGGYAALDFATRFPQSVNALILANTQAPADDDDQIEARNRAIRQVRDGVLEHFADDFLSKAFKGERAERLSVEIDFLKNIIVSQSPSAIINALIAMCARADSTDKLSDIDTPSLVITGSEDFLISETKSAEMHEALLNSRLEILDDVGHLSAVEAPGEFARLVRLFLHNNFSKKQGVTHGKKSSQQQKDRHLSH